MWVQYEFGSSVPEEEYRAVVPGLRVDLINAQYDLRSADFSVVLLLAGNERVAVARTARRLHEWLDARYIDTGFFGAPSEEELERPEFWRYWRGMPAKGRIGLFLGAWAFRAVSERALDKIDDVEFDDRIAHARTMEQELSDDGTLVLKFWIHIPRNELKKRLKKQKGKGNEGEFHQGDVVLAERYDDLDPIIERYVDATDTGDCPWAIVEGTDDRHRDLTVAQSIHAAIVERLAAADTRNAVGRSGATAPSKSTADPGAAGRPTASPEIPDHLAGADLDTVVERDVYKDRLGRLQRKIRKQTRKARRHKQSSVLVFEGWDAAGKGGAIRRMTAAVDFQDFRVVPIAAPTDEERQHHYLWRFWRQLPRDGRMMIFDRSWYGRVLVERVEGFAEETAWRRSYAEINDFEEMIAEHGTIVHKFWLQISNEEQLRRFQEREKTPYKKYKITAEDYRNRERWDDYVLAVNEMIERTNRPHAPWTIVPANDKRSARLTILETVRKEYRRALRAGGNHLSRGDQ